MRKKLFLVLAVVCLIAVFAGVFAGCNNGDGKGGGASVVAGDKIFTQDATLEEIIAALTEADNFTCVAEWHSVSTSESGTQKLDVVRAMRYTQNAYMVSSNETTTEDGGLKGVYDTYTYRSGDIDYSISVYTIESDVIAGNHQTEASKELAQAAPDKYSELKSGSIHNLASVLTTDADGNIAANADLFDYIVAGSTYVKLNGSSIEVGYTTEYTYDDGVTDRSSYKYVWSGVNATTIEIPAEIKALEAEAEWSE